MRSRHLTCFVVAVACIFVGPAGVLGNGGYHDDKLQATATVGNDEWRFTADIDPVMYRVTSLASKYRVIRVNVRSRAEQPLKLSLQKDGVEVTVNGRKVPAILNLRDKDADCWEKSLDDAARAALAYPQVVKPNEENNIFVFVPVSEPADPPAAIRLTFASVPAEVREVELKQERATSKK
jgi:hypothetical protein